MARFMGEAPLMEKKSFIKTGEAIATFSFREVLSGISSLDLFVSGVSAGTLDAFEGIITEKAITASAGNSVTNAIRAITATASAVSRDFFSETFSVPLRIFGKVTFSSSCATTSANTGSVTITLKEIRADASEVTILTKTGVEWRTTSIDDFEPISTQADITEATLQAGSKLKLTLAVSRAAGSGSVRLVTDGSGAYGNIATKLTLQTRLPL